MKIALFITIYIFIMVYVNRKLKETNAKIEKAERDFDRSDGV